MADKCQPLETKPKNFFDYNVEARKKARMDWRTAADHMPTASRAQWKMWLLSEIKAAQKLVLKEREAPKRIFQSAMRALRPQKDRSRGPSLTNSR